MVGGLLLLALKFVRAPATAVDSKLECSCLYTWQLAAWELRAVAWHGIRRFGLRAHPLAWIMGMHRSSL